MKKPTVAEALADLIREMEHVESARAIGNRIYVRFPRERGGRYTMTVPAAKAFIAKETK